MGNWPERNERIMEDSITRALIDVWLDGMHYDSAGSVETGLHAFAVEQPDGFYVVYTDDRGFTSTAGPMDEVAANRALAEVER